MSLRGIYKKLKINKKLDPIINVLRKRSSVKSSLIQIIRETFSEDKTLLIGEK